MSFINQLNQTVKEYKYCTMSSIPDGTYKVHGFFPSNTANGECTKVNMKKIGTKEYVKTYLSKDRFVPGQVKALNTMMKDNTITFIKKGESVRFKVVPALLDITDDEDDDEFMTVSSMTSDFVGIDIPEGVVPY